MTQIARLKRFRRGEVLRAKDLNQAPDLLNKRRGIRYPAQNDDARGTGRVRRFEITAIDGDYLECAPLGNGQETGETIYVSRPYLLQRARTSHNGTTYSYSDDQTRTATSGSATETQSVTPSYVVGDEIMACRVIGGTGVTADDGAAVEWIDMNIDGREWAANLSETDPFSRMTIE